VGTGGSNGRLYALVYAPCGVSVVVTYRVHNGRLTPAASVRVDAISPLSPSTSCGVSVPSNSCQVPYILSRACRESTQLVLLEGTPVIVSYVSLSLGGDPAVFASEYGPLADRIRQQRGCRVYECLADPANPSRRVMLEVWETAEDHAVHLTDPVYIEVLARGTRDWGMHDLQVHTWSRADGHSFLTLERTDTPIPGRDEMNRHVAEFRPTT
jgi:quinol monooxygenase YgiN